MLDSCRSICRNPQNKELDEALCPQASYSPSEAVAVQLEVLRDPSNPKPGAWVQCLYEFCGDKDPFERSRYFGPSKDIYQVRRCYSTEGLALSPQRPNSSVANRDTQPYK